MIQYVIYWKTHVLWLTLHDPNYFLITYDIHELWYI